MLKSCTQNSGTHMFYEFLVSLLLSWPPVLTIILLDNKIARDIIRGVGVVFLLKLFNLHTNLLLYLYQNQSSYVIFFPELNMIFNYLSDRNAQFNVHMYLLLNYKKQAMSLLSFSIFSNSTSVI